jgi:hypothetical protein
MVAPGRGNSVQSALSQRAAASALSSGRVLNAIAASGAALCSALITASNIDRLWGGRRMPAPRRFQPSNALPGQIVSTHRKGGTKDRDPWLLNTPTGTIDLKTGQVRPHHRQDLITKMTTVGPGEACPKWLESSIGFSLATRTSSATSKESSDIP